jgi:hypothetical protein
VLGTTVDLAASLAREVAEETGLTAGDFSAEAGWHCVLAGPRIALMKILRGREPAEDLARRIRAHIASQRMPELADVRMVRGPCDLDRMMPSFMTAFFESMWG